jgi:superfamily II DNA/RNA helicase
MGFSKEISKIMNFIHKKNSAQVPQVALYSATWPAQYKNFVEEVFPGYTFKDIICQGGVQLKRNIETFNIPLGIKEKPKLLEQFLSKEARGSGIIFVNKKEEVKKISEQVESIVGHKKIFQIHGDQKPGERKDAIQSFRSKGGLLIATDIAARGLDVENLSWVLNFDLPFEAVYYVHRCGRTGRAGRQGRVYNFITPADTKLMGRINEAILSQSSLALKTLDPPKSKPQRKKSGASKATSKKVTKKKKPARSGKTPRYKKKKR